MSGIGVESSFTCLRCLRASQRHHGLIPRRRSAISPLYCQPYSKVSKDSEQSSTRENTNKTEVSSKEEQNESTNGARKAEGAMSRRLAEATEEALLQGGRAGRKAVEESGFSEELKQKLMERIETQNFKSENAAAFIEVALPSHVNEGSHGIALEEAWKGTESTENAVLRMLDDARKPLAPGLRGLGKIPSPVVDMRVKRGSQRNPAQRLANARDKSLTYGVTKDTQMSEQERESMRQNLRDRFRPGEGTMPTSFRGLAALANERIEDAIARGQFKNIPRGKGVERDPRSDNPFIDTTEYIMNKMIQRQDIVPPWIEKQQDLVRAANTFRLRLRNDWKRQAARTIASRGGTLQQQMWTAERYAESERVHNPKQRSVEQVSVPTNVTNDPIVVKISQVTPKESPSTASLPTVEISVKTKDGEAVIATSSTEPSKDQEQVPSTESEQSNSGPLPLPFRIPDWEAAEKSYFTLAIANLNNLTRSYNLMAPDLAKKPYFHLDRELKACYADVAPLIAGEIKERATRPAPRPDLVERMGQRSGGLLELFAAGKANVYESKKPMYGLKEFWNDLWSEKKV